ncbi:hypothetical protein B0I35DRAFT_99198 [Stachybotrys elegans]|uniref:DUF676 domain-containing protein n=1 Tax=Stachybotrys elegans TaxID=80388 RepID=A0A8K0SMA9_9HYPO|nr:hypothetical protein B0I35DRAFT_99198 [Stachybotrys elegans]
MWLRDLLPRDLPDARVLSFEYDSQWLRDPNIVTLEDCGNRLLESILWDRTHQGSQSMCPIMARRPIILLGHSYGGLVIKQAMVTAAKAVRDDPKYEYYQAFLASIVGVQFLGTPHNGSTFAEAGILQARVNVAFGGAANAELLRPLVVGSTLKILHELHAAFRYYLENLDHLSGLSSTYFYETKKMKLGPLETKIVVDKNSACYGSRAPSEEVPLEANHKELNKFESRYESNYKRVVGCLAHVHKRAKDLVEARLGSNEPSFLSLNTLADLNRVPIQQLRPWG